MRALCWHGKGDIRCDTVPDPVIEQPRDAIIKVSTCAICGSDLHLMDGYMPTMEEGDVLGHEFMGEVVEVGADVKRLKKGDRVVVPFQMCCGECEQCRAGNWAACERSNRNAELAQKEYGHTTAGLFGYSHVTGGYPGGQAEYVRVPYADVTPLKVPESLTDEQVLFLSDIFPTGWQAAYNCGIERDKDVVAVWGCGPVGQFTIKSALMLSAKRVIAIDTVPERLAMARAIGAETIDFEQTDVIEALREMTGGRMPEKCIDVVGMENHAAGSVGAIMDRAKTAVGLATDRATSLREAIIACRPAGIVSIPAVYNFPSNVPFGAAIQKGLTFKMGQTHVPYWQEDLLSRIEKGEIDPSFVITHRAKLEDGPTMYETFRDKKDGCIKVVMTP